MLMELSVLVWSLPSKFAQGVSCSDFVFERGLVHVLSVLTDLYVLCAVLLNIIPSITTERSPC